MPYCLGLHIDNNFIKYAKVLNEKDKAPKVETYGVVCYENLNMAIENILKETSTYENIEIATNTKNDVYSSFDVFSGMPPANLKKHLALEFQTEICPKLNITASSYDSRYLVSEKKYDQDTDEVVYISVNKTDILNAKKNMKGKVKKILPVSLANLSLINYDNKSNFAVLSIDSTTTLTIVMQGQVKRIINIDIGMGNILSKLNQKYNSYSKSYEKCKSIVLYNENTKDLILEGDTEDVEYITPMLYDINQKVIENMAEYRGMVNNIYVTGDAVIINNIDLYFEGLLEDIHCEVLKPSFLLDNSNISGKIKEYTEVNSAIALAVATGKVNEQNVNFGVNGKFQEELENIKSNQAFATISQKIGQVKEKINAKKKNAENKTEEKNEVQKNENKEFKLPIGNTTLILQTALWTIVLITYIVASNMVANKYEDNTKELNDEIANINMNISQVENDTKAINQSISDYNQLAEKVKLLNKELLELNGASYDVPRLLDGIAVVVPDKVKVTQIAIELDRKVTISAECDQSAELGFFISRLKNEGVMTNITTSIESETADLKKIIVIGDII